MAGSIAAIGPDVPAGRVGERVLVDPAVYERDGDDADPIGLLGSERDGGFAEYVAVDAAAAHDVSGSPLSDAQLSCLRSPAGPRWGC